MEKQFSHIISLVFSFVATLIEYIKMDEIEESIIFSIIVSIVVIVIYYFTARIAILFINMINEIIKAIKEA